MGLLVTSKQASDANVTGPLIDLLLEHGAHARSDERRTRSTASLANHAPRAAEKMIALGAQAGRPRRRGAGPAGSPADVLRRRRAAAGSPAPARQGDDRARRDRARAALCIRPGAARGGGLPAREGRQLGHDRRQQRRRAASRRVRRRSRDGAAPRGEGRRHQQPGQPVQLDAALAWADHNKQADVVQWMRAHCAIDLHDAASFDFREHVEARLREDPASVNRRIDHWDIPQCTPLHWAAAMGHEDAARLLLENGADPNILAGNGFTPLDVADANGAAGVAALLEQHGGTRTAVDGKTSDRAKLKPFETLANDILDAYRSGEPSALQRVQDFFKQTFTLERDAHEAAAAAGQAGGRRDLSRRHAAGRRAHARIRKLGRAREKRDADRRPREELEPAAVSHRREARHRSRCATRSTTRNGTRSSP